MIKWLVDSYQTGRSKPRQRQTEAIRQAPGVRDLASAVRRRAPEKVPLLRALARLVLGGHPSQFAQSMVEFALVLPVLLALLFFVIEGGRLFQVWLSIQNGAREAIRYAVTGQFDSQYCAASAAVLDSPQNAALNPAGIDYAAADLADGVADCSVPSTWTGAHPGQDYILLSEALQDQARLPSIVDAAKAGALAISRNDAALSTASGYFQVTICSTRPWDQNGVTGSFSWSNPTSTSFASCNLKIAGGPTLNYQDAGGPNDRIYISVEFNHPLITPLIAAEEPFVKLTSVREAIVENFRFTKSIGIPPEIGFTSSPPFIIHRSLQTPSRRARPPIPPSPLKSLP